MKRTIVLIALLIIPAALFPGTLNSFEDEDKNLEYLKVPRPYALGLNHKHLPEMQKHIGLMQSPIFMPIVNNYYKGLAVSIPLHTSMFR